MLLHSVIVSYNRVDLTEQAIRSYLETVSVPFSLVVVDNGSTDGTQEWLHNWIRTTAPVGSTKIVLFPENRYPGYATNFGWAEMPEETTHLHRGDNDFVYLNGWCEAMLLRFRRPKVGQVGLRTDEEEMFASSNVGGNNVIRRELWDQGLRYDETPWPEIEPKGFTEDSFFSPAVKQMGWEWTRVMRPCIVPISHESADDPYYKKTWRERGIVR